MDVGAVVVEPDPFSDTRMAEVAAQRRDKRDQRWKPPPRWFVRARTGR